MTAQNRGLWALVLFPILAISPGCLLAQGRAGGEAMEAQDNSDLVAPGADLVPLPGEYRFTEGPAVDEDGNVFFTDIPRNRIYRWSLTGHVQVFRENTQGTNGLYFDSEGNLVACASGAGRIVSIDPLGQLTVVADTYDGTRFNSPNDLWVDREGGVYFSDPVYGRREVVQNGEHVYYVPPDRRRVVRVIDDMVKPNGLIGTPDGKTLYVTDHGGGKTYRYAINDDGTLSHKMLFCKAGGDGMTLDAKGNVYIALADVAVFDPAGKQIATIDIPERPTNMCFGGADRTTLFITARTAVYRLKMNVAGAFTNSGDVTHGPEDNG